MNAGDWHAQWTDATRALEVANLDLTTAVHSLRPEQLGALRRYRERVDEAKAEVERLATEKPTPHGPPSRESETPSQEWPR